MNRYVRYACYALISGAVFFTGCEEDEEEQPEEVDSQPIRLECGYFSTGSSATLQNYEEKSIDYIVSCYDEVTIDVTIDPGTVIAFESESGLRVMDGGSIVANGTADAEITFEGDDPLPGSWKGIYVESTSSRNSMEHVRIEHAGEGTYSSNGETGALVVSGRMAISNSIILSSSSHGLQFPYEGATVSIENTSIEECFIPVRTKIDYVSELEGLSFNGSTNPYVYVEAVWLYGTSGNTTTFHNLGIPYRIQAGWIDNEDRTIEIMAGVIMEFETGSGIETTGSAKLIAKGTSVEPITFRGVDDVPGAWSGLYFVQTESPLNEISHAAIDNAGGGDMGGAIKMWADPFVSVNNVTISNSRTCAFFDAPKSVENGMNPNLTLGGVIYENNQNSDDSAFDPACCDASYCYGS